MAKFSNFQILEPEAKDLVAELLENADRQRSAFMSFMNVWMAFNGWMASVTEGETDAAMLRNLVCERRLINAYDELMANNRQFRRMIEDFAAMWPVLNVRDVRKKLGRDAFRRFDNRDELIAAGRAADVKQQPSVWAAGEEPTWEQVLRTIYQVRCNLFHGEKSPQNVRDRRLILKSDRILRAFLAETDCLSWYD